MRPLMSSCRWGDGDGVRDVVVPRSLALAALLSCTQSSQAHVQQLERLSAELRDTKEQQSIALNKALGAGGQAPPNQDWKSLQLVSAPCTHALFPPRVFSHRHRRIPQELSAAVDDAKTLQKEKSALQGTVR